MLTYGSLFSGYEGLSLGCQSVLPGRTAWVSDIDKGSCKLLAHRFPDVPNLGDITKVDWSQVKPVDVLTGGFPCQDVSAAGKRAGIRPGTRSGLWAMFAYAISQLRPRLVVIENVRGLLSARAHSDVEPCPWCVGDDPDGALRALGAILGDLAALGYDAQWHGVRAADVGAPHGRFRVFVVAYPRELGWNGWADIGGSRRSPAIGSEARGHVGYAGGALLPTPAVNDMGASYTPDEWDAWTARMKAAHGNGNGHGASLAIEAQRLLPTPTGQDGSNNGGPSQSDRNTVPLNVIAREIGHASTTEARPGKVLPGVRGADVPQAVRREARGQDSLPVAEDVLSGVREQSRRGDEGGPSHQGQEARRPDVPGLRDDETATRPPRGQESGEQRSGQPHDALRELSSETPLAGGPGEAPSGIDWGPYAAAIHRWEVVLGRQAPHPTQLSSKGNPQLSARFVEFLMGLPSGWITDTPGLSRNEMLKLCGNGVVPQQAEAALRLLLAREVVAA